MLEMQPFPSSFSVYFFSHAFPAIGELLCLVLTSSQKTLPDSLWNHSVSFLARVSFLLHLEASEMKLKSVFSENIFFTHSPGNFSLILLGNDWHSEEKKTKIL